MQDVKVVKCKTLAAEQWVIFTVNSKTIYKIFFCFMPVLVGGGGEKSVIVK